MEETRRVSDHNLRLLERQRRFVQDAAHELGTPITVALGHAELIQRNAADSTIVRDAKVTADELLRLRRLASGLLLLASADGPDFLHLTPVDLNDLVLEAVGRWEHSPRHWSFTGMDDAIVRGDRDSLVMALDALIDNAVKHTHKDGRIELSVRREDADVVVAVADSGPGIPAGEVERIFDRFSRTDSARDRETGGFGLGLAIVKAIAEAHGGSARVRTSPGRGSAFELALPELPADERSVVASDTRPDHVDGRLRDHGDRRPVRRVDGARARGRRATSKPGG